LRLSIELLFHLFSPPTFLTYIANLDQSDLRTGVRFLMLEIIKVGALIFTIDNINQNITTALLHSLFLSVAE
jgi:hypothetical protein